MSFVTALLFSLAFVALLALAWINGWYFAKNRGQRREKNCYDSGYKLGMAQGEADGRDAWKLEKRIGLN